MAGITTHRSNQLETLIAPLAKALYGSADPFSRRIVLVPHIMMRQWIQRELVERIPSGGVAGVEWMLLDQGLAMLASGLNTADTAHYPSGLELSFAIQREVYSLASEQGGLRRLLLEDSSSKDIAEAWGEKQHRRVLQLTRRLTRLFSLYGRVDSKKCEQWYSKPIGWQQEIWSGVYSKHKDWSWRLRSTEKNTFILDSQPVVAVFGVDYFDPWAQHVIEQCAQQADVHLYLLSACQHFWGDLLSDKELGRTQRRLEGRSLSDEQRETLEGLLLDRNSLLANWGRLSRKQSAFLEQFPVQASELYTVASFAAESERYRDNLLPDTEVDLGSSKSALRILQTDLLTLINPNEHEREEVSSEDCSFRVLRAPSRLRETEIVYQEILDLIRLFREQGKELEPKDFLVLAPNMQEFRSYIEAVFGSRESQLSYQFSGLSLVEGSAYVSALNQLLDLSGSRWEGYRIIQLFSNPCFQARHKISQDDVMQLREWIEESGIYWGYTSSHRRWLLQRAHCSKGPVDTSEVGTWKHGISRLIRGLCLSHPNIEEGKEEPVPAMTIDPTESDLLGKLIGLLKSLYQDLLPLVDNTEKTLADWSEYLRCLLDTYLLCEGGKDEQNAAELVQRQIAAINIAQRWFHTDLWRFSSIHERVKHALQETALPEGEGTLQAVRFASLHSGAVLPAKVLILMGMEDGVFPGTERMDPLNLLGYAKEEAQIPSVSELDRQTFLQAVLNARCALRISYRGINPADGKEQNPSLLVTELFNYLDSAIDVEGQFPSMLWVDSHPFYPFDSKYFSSQSSLSNYSKTYYKAACAWQIPQKNDPHQIVPEWFDKHYKPRISPPDSHAETIALQDIISAVSEPMRVYCNQRLGLYLRDPQSHGLVDTEPFVLSSLEKFQIKQRCLHAEPSKVLDRAFQTGVLPAGQFGAAAKERVQLEVRAAQCAMKNLEIRSEDLFTLHLDPHCEEVSCRETGDWVVPAPRVDLNGHIMTLVGQIPSLSPQALLTAGELSKGPHLVRIWPKLLTLEWLVQKYPELESVIPTTALFLDDGKNYSLPSIDFEDALTMLVQFYHISCEAPVPLIDEWIKSYVTKSPEEIQETVHKSLSGDHFFRKYLAWGMSSHQNLPLETILSWQSWVQDVFSTFFKKGR